jgi:hypothetical protein
LRSAIKEFMSNPEVLDRFRKGGTELGVEPQLVVLG